MLSSSVKTQKEQRLIFNLFVGFIVVLEIVQLSRAIIFKENVLPICIGFSIILVMYAVVTYFYKKTLKKIKEYEDRLEKEFGGWEKLSLKEKAELAKKMEVHSLICDSVFIEEFLEYHKQKEMQFKTGGGAPSEN